MVGEHGVSQVFLWSTAHIAGVPISKLIEERGERVDEVRKQVEENVRYASITIIDGNDASQLASALSRHGSRKWFFAMSVRPYRSAVATTGSASRCRFRVLSDEAA